MSYHSGRYILSASEPFNEEKTINFRKLKNWLDMLGLSYEYMHTPGPLSQEEVFALCEEVGAKKIVPVHTKSTKIFEKQLITLYHRNWANPYPYKSIPLSWRFITPEFFDF